MYPSRNRNGWGEEEGEREGGISEGRDGRIHYTNAAETRTPFHHFLLALVPRHLPEAASARGDAGEAEGRPHRRGWNKALFVAHSCWAAGLGGGGGGGRGLQNQRETRGPRTGAPRLDPAAAADLILQRFKQDLHPLPSPLRSARCQTVKLASGLSTPPANTPSLPPPGPPPAFLPPTPPSQNPPQRALAASYPTLLTARKTALPTTPLQGRVTQQLSSESESELQYPSTTTAMTEAASAFITTYLTDLCRFFTRALQFTRRRRPGVQILSEAGRVRSVVRADPVPYSPAQPLTPHRSQTAGQRLALAKGTCRPVCSGTAPTNSTPSIPNSTPHPPIFRGISPVPWDPVSITWTG